MTLKQVIVMRTDLNMRKGKMVAQGAHASMKVLLDAASTTYAEEGLGGGGYPISLDIPLDANFRPWLEGAFTKVCLKAESEQELDELYLAAKNSGLPCSLIIDNGLTEFNGIKTKTCIAIGPAQSDEIDKITGHLKLL